MPRYILSNPAQATPALQASADTRRPEPPASVAPSLNAHSHEALTSTEAQRNYG